MRINIADISTSRVCIGYEGEQNHAQVVFDCGSLFYEYPDATAQMAVRPPVGDIYPHAVSRDGNDIVWNVTASDCATPGNGEYQLTFVSGETIVKSYIGFFSVRESLVANGEAPEGVEDWLETAQAALEAFDELTASATTLPAGSEATAEVTMVGGHKNVSFCIPKGDQGEQGDPGDPGEPGQDGVSPILSVTDITGGHRVTIVDASGTKTFDVMDGEQGQPGYSPTVTVTDITGGHTVTITDKTGDHSFNVMDGQQGEPGDPTELIDDESTAENKVWSASKVSGTVSNLNGAINDKQDAPASGAAAGKVLGLTEVSNELVPTWVSQPGVPVQDVQVNGTSILSQGVANVPVANATTPGAVKVSQDNSVCFSSINQLILHDITLDNVKAGTTIGRAVVPAIQHASAFYGLAKASGDTTQSSSSNAVGQYTETAKRKITDMIEPQFRLIKEITISEETGKILINTDSNGNGFAIKEATILFDGVKANNSGNAAISVNNGQTIYGDNVPFLGVSQLFNTTAQKRTAHIWTRGGKFFGESTHTNVSATYSYVYMDTSINATGIIDCGTITEICVGTLNTFKFTEGTIKIYGR